MTRTPRGDRLSASAYAFCLLHCDRAFHECRLDLERPDCPLRAFATRALPPEVPLHRPPRSADRAPAGP